MVRGFRRPFLRKRRGNASTVWAEVRNVVGLAFQIESVSVQMIFDSYLVYVRANKPPQVLWLAIWSQGDTLESANGNAEHYGCKLWVESPWSTLDDSESNLLKGQNFPGF